MSSDGQFRSAVLEHLRKHVVGPEGGPEEEISELPYRRYLVGTLYPRGASVEAVTGEDEADGTGAIGDDRPDDPVTLANEWAPSSIGISFRVAGPALLDVDVVGARYEGKGHHFKRVPIADDEQPETVRLIGEGESRNSTSHTVLDARAEVRVLWRPYGLDEWLVTVSLVNARSNPSESGLADPTDCLHQVGLLCRAPEGTILDYPSVDRVVADNEDEELALLHRSARVYAIGHGVAVDWDEEQASPASVRTVSIPSYELAGVSPDWPTEAQPEVLNLEHLADDDLDGALLREQLHRFVGVYDEWVNGLESTVETLPGHLQPAAGRLLRRMRGAALRMHDGIETLNDPDVLLCFRLANLAMIMQMRHAEPDLGGTRRERKDAIRVDDVSYTGRGYRWRPFQLAFFLLVLRGLVDPDHEDRELVDLIWFPTGGGKTEAYLAVAAFEVLLRRLRHGNGGAGTAILTRYTLRLLTAQQFQRAATLICALENLRRPLESRMGNLGVRIGLWVGQAVTPSSFQQAIEAATQILDDSEPTNRFQLETCPWCGTEIVPSTKSDERSDYGFEALNNRFVLRCPNGQCTFADELPIAVVDDELYREPPAFVVGTVDKFARLAWDPGGGAFFGLGGTHLAPSIIIQDELHLLSGPLGTAVGVYERAIEALSSRFGRTPKVIASTATIRRADDQVRALFGREVVLFPPAGLDAGDSFFARADRSRPGRLYVGLMSQSHTAATTNVQTSTTLLLAPLEVEMSDAERNAMWTLVAYHNNLRELGRSVTQFRDDVPQMLRARAKDQNNLRQLDDDVVLELTSNVSAERLPRLLARLFRDANDKNPVSVLVTTNMLSVGVDVPRLGLMLVNGQPKTTAEYIQATSRVGRGGVPGIVVAMLSATKPRDRSHYETFKSYHQVLYQQVEPTSVTPFSLPSRRRALHAALVILVRHAGGLPANADAHRFDPNDPQIQAVVETLKRRIRFSDPDEADAVDAHLDDLVADWTSRVERATVSGATLHYSAGNTAVPSLLRDFGAAGDGWETLQSMRNVDREVRVRIEGARKP
jgi:hypothetical protein